MDEFCISREAQHVMSYQAETIHSTLDFNRPYRDIVTRRGRWVMEEWKLWWMETRSVFILQPYKDKKSRQMTPVIADPEVLNMWGAVRRVVMHFMQTEVDTESISEETASKLAQDLQTTAEVSRRSLDEKLVPTTYTC